jgi:hypothetical protein
MFCTCFVGGCQKPEVRAPGRPYRWHARQGGARGAPGMRHATACWACGSGGGRLYSSAVAAAFTCSGCAKASKPPSSTPPPDVSWAHVGEPGVGSLQRMVLNHLRCLQELPKQAPAGAVLHGLTTPRPSLLAMLAAGPAGSTRRAPAHAPVPSNGCSAFVHLMLVRTRNQIHAQELTTTPIHERARHPPWSAGGRLAGRGAELEKTLTAASILCNPWMNAL